MRATLAKMRSAVAGWLYEEDATQEQTLQLLDVLYAGAINGSHYTGHRQEQSDLYVSRAKPIIPSDEVAFLGLGECGCLVDTMETIKDERPGGVISGVTAEAFNLACKIPLGATPFDNRWARAAADGIGDYYAARGWK